MAEGATKLQVKTGEKKGNLAPVPEWRPFEALRQEVDRLFDSFGGGFWPSPFRRSAFEVLASRIHLERRAGRRYR